MDDFFDPSQSGATQFGPPSQITQYWKENLMTEDRRAAVIDQNKMTIVLDGTQKRRAQALYDRMNPLVRGIVMNCIAMYLSPRRFTVAKIQQDIEREVVLENMLRSMRGLPQFAVPSFMVVRSIIRQLDRNSVQVARFGLDAAAGNGGHSKCSGKPCRAVTQKTPCSGSAEVQSQIEYFESRGMPQEILLDSGKGFSRNTFDDASPNNYRA